MSQIKIGLLGGTGLGSVLEGDQASTRHEIDTPFGRPSGPIIETQWDGLPVLLLSRHGPGHLISPSRIPSRANIFALKQLGVTHLLASGAVGSLREEFHPRDLVIPDQIIDKTNGRPGTFYENAAVHVEFAEPFCPVLRQTLLDAAKRASSESQPLAVHERACYVCMDGPAFSTRAESLMHRLWGGDLIGMTAMPEAKLAREAEIAYALVALVTDYDCWRARPATAEHPPQDKHALLAEIIGNVKAATDNAMRLLREAVKLLSERRDTLPPSPAHSALELAIWSDKQQIPPDQVEQLRPLWGRYFACGA